MVRVERRELRFHLRDLERQTAGFGDQSVGGGQRHPQVIQRIEIQRAEIARLVLQHHGLVLQLLNLVVDLLQGAGRGQQVLGEVGGVEDGEWRGPGRPSRRPAP